MPIANCFLNQALTLPTSDDKLIDLWAQAAQVSSEHMTVNIINPIAQYGQAYAIISNLYLPSLWPANKVITLQEGLAQALATFYALNKRDILVITQIVDSGHVVEDGSTLQWQA